MFAGRANIFIIQIQLRRRRRRRRPPSRGQ